MTFQWPQMASLCARVARADCQGRRQLPTAVKGLHAGLQIGYGDGGVGSKKRLGTFEARGSLPSVVLRGC